MNINVNACSNYNIYTHFPFILEKNILKFKHNYKKKCIYIFSIYSFEFEARVINKTEVITYSSGKLFKLILLDENREMKCTAFNENVDKFINEFLVFIFF